MASSASERDKAGYVQTELDRDTLDAAESKRDVRRERNRGWLRRAQQRRESSNSSRGDAS